MIKTLCLSALSAALLVAAPAHSQSRRELAERLDAVEARIAQVETSSMAGDPVAETLLRRLDELDYQMRELTSETERLNFENRQLRSQVEALQAQLDRRGRATGGYDDMGADGLDETGADGADRGDLDEDAVAWMSEGLDEADDRGRDIAVVDPDDPYAEARAEATGVLGAPSRRPVGEPSSDTRAPAAPDPETLYGDARDKLLEGDFGGAQVDFEQFVNAYPDHARTGEAWYWLGETFFVRSDFTGAADAYIAALRAEPNGEKAPDALVRLAASLNGMGRRADACGTLQRFESQFPNASAASRARASREAVRAGC